jgi:hypothetical protein
LEEADTINFFKPHIISNKYGTAIKGFLIQIPREESAESSEVCRGISVSFLDSTAKQAMTAASREFSNYSFDVRRYITSEINPDLTATLQIFCTKIS